MSFTVSTPEYPYFHPKDCETLVQVLGLGVCTTYGVYDRKSKKWTITSLAQKVIIGSKLLLRSAHVTACSVDDTPSFGPSKRAASPISATATASKKIKTEPQEIIELEDTDDEDNGLVHARYIYFMATRLFTMVLI